MNYLEEKKEILKRTYSLFENLEIFNHESLEIITKIYKLLNNEQLSKNEMEDLIETVKNNDLSKLYRLSACLMYVENPNDKDITSNLIENIMLNSSNGKSK